MIIKQEWSIGYYNRIMQIIAHAMISDIKFPSYIKHGLNKVMNNVPKYATLYYDDPNSINDDTSIYIRLTDNEQETVAFMAGFYFAYGFGAWAPNENLHTYSDAIIEKTEAWRKAKIDKQNKIKEEIKNYIAECERNNIRIVKSHFARENKYPYDLVLKLWHDVMNEE